MYIIVVGAGTIGSQVIELVTREQNEVVVIEENPERANAVSRDYDCLVVNADATEKETLEQASADGADAIIATTEEDAVNIMVLLLARDIGIPSLVSVVQNPDHMNLFRQLGANVLENPQRLIAEYLVRAVQRPSIKDFMSLGGGAEVFEITVTDEAQWPERRLSEAGEAGLLPDGVLVIAIERDGNIVTPRGDTEIRAGDLATVFSRDGVTDPVMRQFTGSS
ncbi:LOW QUALITY PROTEIN: Trk system potassium uptake protein TrkA [Halarchaeum acidiphilum MH1-52-1]|uniref:Trk system potassium uptake protein TrkA n=1 Tax=Halarchaeum acidiphilum MH1-52-1 TaxID=1261545 RepID=U3AC87_9EURY|nr:LOW QUALITY PROTEIN: Trk system potassium uptake protein TrkA [Halarchaeum acidiphilum MH1-52-1]